MVKEEYKVIYIFWFNREKVMYKYGKIGREYEKKNSYSGGIMDRF